MRKLNRAIPVYPLLLVLSACGGGSSDTGGGQGAGPNPNPDPNPDPNPIAAKCSVSPKTFIKSGSSVVPAGCTKVSIKAVGAGGGSGGSIVANTDDSAQGGSPGRADEVGTVDVNPGVVLVVTVGKGGQGGGAADGLDRGFGGRGGSGDPGGSSGTAGKKGVLVLLPHGGGGGGGGGGASSVRIQGGPRLVNAPGGDGGDGADCGLLCAGEGKGGTGGPAAPSVRNDTSYGHAGAITIGGSGQEGQDGAVILTYSD